MERSKVSLACSFEARASKIAFAFDLSSCLIFQSHQKVVNSEQELRNERERERDKSYRESFDVSFSFSFSNPTILSSLGSSSAKNRSSSK